MQVLLTGVPHPPWRLLPRLLEISLPGGSEYRDVLPRCELLVDLMAPGSEQVIVGPHAGEQLGEDEGAVERDLKCAHLGNHLKSVDIRLRIRDEL